ncbi:MAG: hypothetical protein EBR30_03060 [Cytophagia bacterium]|jgi:hypothetical protein|nr:hypothetical protein [Cytophagia bacterium]NBW34015.1 hypothetical protein [Cytophagia bacterium]
MEQLELFEDTKNNRFGVYLDFETIDRITVAGLKSYLDSVQTGLADYRKGDRWLHPDDIVHSEKAIEALKLILRDFGEET